jgi:hypothetical protein
VATGDSDDWLLILIVYILIPLVLLFVWWLLAPKRRAGETYQLRWSSVAFGIGLAYFAGGFLRGVPDWGFPVLAIAAFMVSVVIRRFEGAR